MGERLGKEIENLFRAKVWETALKDNPHGIKNVRVFLSPKGFEKIYVSFPHGKYELVFSTKLGRELDTETLYNRILTEKKTFDEAIIEGENPDFFLYSYVYRRHIMETDGEIPDDNDVFGIIDDAIDDSDQNEEIFEWLYEENSMKKMISEWKSWAENNSIH